MPPAGNLRGCLAAAAAKPLLNHAARALHFVSLRLCRHEFAPFAISASQANCVFAANLTRLGFYPAKTESREIGGKVARAECRLQPEAECKHRR